MYSLSTPCLSKLAPTLKRVLIVDPNTMAAKLLAEIVKGLGGRDVLIEGDQRAALEAVATFEPGLIFTERSGPRLSGEDFTRKLRRSTLNCRRVPVIMVTPEATATTIRGARDSGVHEFLRKPFTAGDLTRRIEVVAVKPRDWVEGMGYVGPDRRRFNSGAYEGPRKRGADKGSSEAEMLAAAKDQAMRILATALERFDKDPVQAVRAIRQQAESLKAVALKTSDAQLAVASASLDEVMAGGSPARAALLEPVRAVLALAAAEGLKRAG